MTTIITSYFVSGNTLRNKEIAEAIINNCNAENIDLVILVSEQKDCNYPKHDKILFIYRENRPTYNELIGISSEINPSGINILANTDMYFKDEDLEIIKEVDFNDVVLALSRYDKDMGNWTIKVRSDSQDTWIWKGKLSVKADFHMGVGGCDGTFAHILVDSGKTVINPCISIKSYHNHFTAGVSHEEKALPKPYYFPEICSYTKKKISNFYFICMGEGGFNKIFRKWDGVEYHEFIYAHKTEEEIRNTIFSDINRINPDIIFMQFHDDTCIKAATIKEMASKAPVVNWCGDVASGNMPHFYNEWTKYCVLCFSNDDYRIHLNLLGNKKAYYFNIFDVEQYWHYNTKKTHDIVFIGSHYGQYRFSGFRKDMIDFLKNEYKDGFKLFGSGWDKEYNAQTIGRDDSNIAYNQSKIAINASQENMIRYTSDRLFHILGSGTFCLCHYFPDCESLFTDGVHLRYFKDYDELKQLIDYYLVHEAERNRIAEAGNIRCRELFGADALINKLNQIHSFS